MTAAEDATTSTPVPTARDAAAVPSGPLPTLLLGAEGLRVGAQGLGCMGMSEFYELLENLKAADQRAARSARVRRRTSR